MRRKRRWIFSASPKSPARHVRLIAPVSVAELDFEIPLLAQHDTVRGFRKAIYSGLTTHEIIRVIEHVLVEFPHCSGLYHVSSDPVSKYDLLMLVKAAMNVPVEIVPDDSLQCDRSLDSSRFRREFYYRPPSWEIMIQELQKQRREQVP